MDMQECKVFFADVDTSKEQAQEIISRYAKATIDTYQEKRTIGINTVTFAVVSLPVKAAGKIVDDPAVKRVDVLITFKAANSCAEECSGGG